MFYHYAQSGNLQMNAHAANPFQSQPNVFWAVLTGGAGSAAVSPGKEVRQLKQWPSLRPIFERKGIGYPADEGGRRFAFDFFPHQRKSTTGRRIPGPFGIGQHETPGAVKEEVGLFGAVASGGHLSHLHRTFKHHSGKTPAR
jgi:hypothetical protein